MAQQKSFTVGAALRSFDLVTYQDWVLDGNRDLEIQDPAMPALLDADWRFLAQDLVNRLDGYTGRIGIHGPFYGINIGAFDSKIQETISGRMMQALDFAEFIHGTHMVIHSPFSYFGNQFGFYGEKNMTIDAVHKTLKEPLKKAADIGCTIVIENIYDKNPTLLLDLVRSFESDFVKMSLDVGHALIMQKSGGGPTPDQWVAAAGDLLGHIHIQDTDGMEDRHWPPGVGEVNFYALFEQIQKLKQTPRLILELDDHSLILDGANHLIEKGVIAQ